MINCVQVVLAAKGYPGSYTKGTLIRNLDSVKDAKVCCLPLSEPPAPCIESMRHPLKKGLHGTCFAWRIGSVCRSSMRAHPPMRTVAS